MEIINLNLIPTGTRPVVHASQYDNGRQFRANLFEGASVYTLTGAETLTFSVRKPDGHIVTEAVTNTSDNYVVIETTTQMCACAGDSFAELKIEEGDDLIGTLNLILAVEQSPEEGGDPSESFIHNLEEQIYDAVADQYDSNNVIFDNAPTSGHGTPYTVTSEGIKDAIDNAISGLTIPENITDLADVDVTTPTDGEILVYNNGTWENQANPASTANFGPDYDENTTYNTGDKVIYQGLFYVCNDDNVTGTWDATKWDALTVADLNGKLLPMSTTDPDKVADRIEALEKANDSSLLYKPTVTEPTLTNGNNYNHRTYYYKHGTRVCLSLGVSGLNIGLSGQILFVLPSGYKPRLSLSLGTCGYSFDKTSAVQILDNGTVIVQYTTDQGCFGYIEFDAYS